MENSVMILIDHLNELVNVFQESLKPENYGKDLAEYGECDAIVLYDKLSDYEKSLFSDIFYQLNGETAVHMNVFYKEDGYDAPWIKIRENLLDRLNWD